MPETAAAEPQTDEFGDPVVEPAAAGNGVAPPGQEPPAPPAAAEPPAAEEPPWAERFESVEEMWEAFQNVDTLRGRLANEVGQLRSQHAEPQPQPQADGGERPLTPEELQELADEDPLAAADYLMQERMGQFAAHLEQRFGPVFQSVNQSEARSAIDELKSEFGDETVLRHKEALAERLQADEAYFLDPATRQARLADVVKAREYERLTKAQQPRTPTGQYAPGSAGPVHVEGGSTPPPSGVARTDVDPVIAEMDEVGPGRDMFGNLPPR